jgi:hypothetical protein
MTRLRLSSKCRALLVVAIAQMLALGATVMLAAGWW